jgi:hypothetical protein
MWPVVFPLLCLSKRDRRLFGSATGGIENDTHQPKEACVMSTYEAYAMEQNMPRMLDSMIETTEHSELKSALEQHKRETEQQAERLRRDSRRTMHRRHWL